MRQLIILRDDLNMSPGKIAAMTSHCSLAFLNQWIKNNVCHDETGKILEQDGQVFLDGRFDAEIYHNWIEDIFRKIICKAKTRDKLLKVLDKCKELGLEENKDYFLVEDYCFTEIKPEIFDENGQGRTLVGIGFRPLPDDIAKELSKNYRLF